MQFIPVDHGVLLPRVEEKSEFVESDQPAHFVQLPGNFDPVAAAADSGARRFETVDDSGANRIGDYVEYLRHLAADHHLCPSGDGGAEGVDVIVGAQVAVDCTQHGPQFREILGGVMNLKGGLIPQFLQSLLEACFCRSFPAPEQHRDAQLLIGRRRGKGLDQKNDHQPPA